jgi:hypothetical protein
MDAVLKPDRSNFSSEGGESETELVIDHSQLNSVRSGKDGQELLARRAAH